MASIRPLLDFSASINPLGPPAALLRELEEAARDRAELGRYPEPDSRTLRAALGRQLGVDPAAIVVGNGAAALLHVALRALAVRSCVVPTPTFSEDRQAMTTAGARWHSVALDPSQDFALEGRKIVAKLEAENADVCLITNPHNPSGALSARDTVLHLSRELSARAAATIVDEAFFDYAPEASVTQHAASSTALVSIRSLTKFFAVPALRVGYAVCKRELAERMRAELPSWPVTTIASRAVAAALNDLDFARRTRAINARERRRLTRDLRAPGLAPHASHANFVLIELPPKAPLASELTTRLVLDARIVVRDCSSFEGLEAGRHIRVAVRSAAENDRLIAALARALS